MSSAHRPAVLLLCFAFHVATCHPAEPGPDADVDGGDGDVDADGSTDARPDGDGEHHDGDMDGSADSSLDGDPPLDLLEAVELIATPLVDPSGEDESRAVGLVVVLVSRSYSGVVGLGALRAGGAESPDGGTFFQIGSVTKPVTGLILASLVESAEVSAEDLVNDHLAPDLRAPAHEGGGITLLHLVSHYASLPEMPDDLSGPPTSPATDYSRAMLGSFLARTELASAPGTTYTYSNLGAGLLGVALADTTGAPGFDTLLGRHITLPLGMVETGTNEPGLLGRLGDRLAQGYFERGGALVEVDLADMGVLAAGGEIISTGDDVTLLLRAFTGLEPFPIPGAVERALTPLGPGSAGTRVGYGIDILESPEGTLQYEKAGLVAGYSTFVTFRRDPAVGVAMLSNRGGHRDIQAAARAVLATLAELDESS